MSKIKLVAPEAYTLLTPKEKDEICNGCGAKGGIPVPNTMYLLNIKEACQVHDFMYHSSMHKDDKVICDLVFKHNLFQIIEHETWFGFVEKLRKIIAEEYYLVVSIWGNDAYWTKDKLLKGDKHEEPIYTNLLTYLD